MASIDPSYIATTLYFYPVSLYAPYAIWPCGLSSSMPGAMKFVRGSPVSLAAEQRAMVGELISSVSHHTIILGVKIRGVQTSSR